MSLDSWDEVALTILRRYAIFHPSFTALELRRYIELAGLPPPKDNRAYGALFRAAKNKRWIFPGDYEESTDPVSHSRPVRRWHSMLYEARSAA